VRCDVAKESCADKFDDHFSNKTFDVCYVFNESVAETPGRRLFITFLGHLVTIRFT